MNFFFTQSPQIGAAKAYLLRQALSVAAKKANHTVVEQAKEADLVIVFGSSLPNSAELVGKKVFLSNEDAAIASIMIQLQAEDLGLGSCWIQVRERFTATGMPSGEYVHTLLDIPLQLQVVSIIAVGHKGMERKPFNEDHLQWEKIHINKFGGK